MATSSTTVTYANGVAVTYTRGLSDANGRALWHYRVTTDDGAEIEESDYAPTKRECVELARICRDSLAYRYA